MTYLMIIQQLLCGKQALTMTTDEHCTEKVESSNHCIDLDKIEHRIMKFQ